MLMDLPMATSPTAHVRRSRARRGAGDQLRHDVVAAANRLWATTGEVDKVSVRAVADAVGVTTPSIYLHFGSKDTLLEAVAAEVLAALDGAMATALANRDDPVDALCGCAMTYVEFALEHPSQYRFAMMERPRPSPTLDRIVARSALKHLETGVRACIDADVVPSQDPHAAALGIWATAHGIAALIIAKALPPWADRRIVANHALRSAVLGYTVSDGSRGDG